jgi:hypothetical protein
MPVPQPTDESDANTLPDPELNPLLNPLLAANMGRWAEVYFTNPPERRGQAVSELLRELENISPAEAASIQVINDEKKKRKTEKPEAPHSFPAAVEPVHTCTACAYDNSEGQRFCGMCGAPLPVGGDPEYAIEPAISSSAASGHHSALEPTWPLPERKFSIFAVESEPVPYRYRLYVGVVLAILLTVLLAVLGYRAWRGTETPSSAAPQSPPSSATPTAPATSAQQQLRATRIPLPESNPLASPVPSHNQPDASSRNEQAAKAPPAPQAVPVAASSTAVAVEPSVAEDLATAQKYLNGSPSMTRDSREAAQWLWKAVGKGNLAATMALSDLYLRGDGVPKSCDQARLLLNAAARKGVKAAADQLRNLQAFGCE